MRKVRATSLPATRPATTSWILRTCGSFCSMLRDTLSRFVARGTTVFLTSHVLEIVEKLCTHVGIIARGKLVHQGSMEELRQTSTLEQRFLEVVGADEVERPKLSWLEAAR